MEPQGRDRSKRTFGADEEERVKTRVMMLRLLMVFALAVVTVGAVGVRGSGMALAQDNMSCAGEPIGGDAAAASPEAGASPMAGMDMGMGSPMAGMEMGTPAAGGGGDLNIAFLPKDVVNPYFGTAAQGGQGAAAELGGQFQQVGPQTSNAAEQVTYIQTLTQQQVGAIAVSANDPNALAQSLKDAMAQGIKVVSFDSDVAPDARQIFVNQANAEQIGRIEVQIMGRLLNCQGEIAILSAASTMTNQNTWISFMEDELSKPGYENMTLVETAYGDDDPQISYDKTVELLTAYPDLKGIISPTTVGITAAAQALEAEGRGGDVQLTGLGTPNQMRAYVKSGTVKEFALWNPADLGYLAYYAAARLITGEITGAEGDTIEAGRLGSYTVGANGEVLLGPPFIFNAENIDQFDF